MGGNEFRFFLSCDINLPVTFRIERLEGKLPAAAKSPNSADVDSTTEERKAEVYVECALYINGAPFGLPMRTRLESPGPSYCWNELITLSTKYRDLTANSQLALTVWDVSCGENEGLISGATIHLFNMKKQLKTGKQKLRLWLGKEADWSIHTTTPGKVPKEERGEVERLEKLVNKYERGQIQRIDWLDRLAFKAMEKIKERESSKNGSSHLYVVVDFCSFEHRVVFQSGKVYLQRCNSPNTSASSSEHKNQTSQAVSKLQDLNFPPASKQPLSLFDDTSLDLKLVQSSSSSPSFKYQSVCTLDKVKSALERAEKETIRKRSISMSQSSSPSNSSSSTKETDHVDFEEKSSPSFAAGCPCCLLYVLISKSNPKCPRCNMIVPSPMPLKKPRIDLNISI